MKTRSPIERTLRYATTVDDLMAAWQFVMECIEKVGKAPSVSINPVWTINVLPGIDEDTENPPMHFEVVVSGMEEIS